MHDVWCWVGLWGSSNLLVFSYDTIDNTELHTRNIVFYVKMPEEHERSIAIVWWHPRGVQVRTHGTMQCG
jgi:hypothetical protein